MGRQASLPQRQKKVGTRQRVAACKVKIGTGAVPYALAARRVGVAPAVLKRTYKNSKKEWEK